MLAHKLVDLHILPAILLLCSVATSSCSDTRWQMQAPCEKSSSEDLIASLTTLVGQEGMDIYIVDTKLGILQAQGIGKTGMRSWGFSHHWNFTVKDDTIFAFAKVVKWWARSSNDDIGSRTTARNVKEEFYSTENAPKDASWFWNIYNGITTLCPGQPIVFVEKE